MSKLISFQNPVSEAARYTPFKDLTTVTAHTSATVILKEVIGEGVLHEAYLHSNFSSGAVMKITADGVVVLLSSEGSNTQLAGLFNSSATYYNSSTGELLALPANATLRTIANAWAASIGDLGTTMVTKNLILTDGISFKQSLKVELVAGVSNTKNVFCVVSGKIKTS